MQVYFGKEDKSVFIEDDDYFYCYNVKLFKFLTRERNISYVATEKNEWDDRVYAIFKRNKQLSEAIREYRKLHNL